MRVLTAILPIVALSAACAGLTRPAALPTAFARGDTEPVESREALIARSKVWLPVDTRSKDLLAGPQGPDAFPPGADVTCTYTGASLSGASPKFACVRDDAEDDELKVKYAGGNSGEVYGEVAATRLLWALGFGADHMYSVRVICRGCPPDIGLVQRSNGERVVDPAAIERKMPARVLLDAWHWDELDLVDESVGGASRAERDALKLLAVFLQHTDSKPDQQRVVCVGDDFDDEGRCVTPLMMVHDVGITFGRSSALNQQPRGSVNLAEWSTLPVWKGDTGCVGHLSGSIRGTLRDPVISEEGRAFLADRLMQLSERQIRDMFEAARVHLRPRQPGSARAGFPEVDEWVAAFNAKRAQITDRRCEG